jgi:hypothetical protein
MGHGWSARSSPASSTHRLDGCSSRYGLRFGNGTCRDFHSICKRKTGTRGTLNSKSVCRSCDLLFEFVFSWPM